MPSSKPQSTLTLQWDQGKKQLKLCLSGTLAILIVSVVVALSIALVIWLEH